MKVAICTPFYIAPTPPYIEALEASIPVLQAAGWEDFFIQEIGCPYISHARATMTRKALDIKDLDTIVYIDYDLSWQPKDLLHLLETKGDVVAGTYRYKKDEEEYMGSFKVNGDDTPRLTFDNTAIQGHTVPAGFLKVTRNAIRRMMKNFPELAYGDLEKPSFDLFQHGAHDGVWYGEDMAFCRRWIKLGGEIVLVPDLSLNHHKKLEDGSYKEYKGNLHTFLIGRKQAGL
ncbi:MAG TPA: hypothetical protein VIM16_00890 [Mucilaginibacter sp.]|jgi:hypothetical protein